MKNAFSQQNYNNSKISFSISSGLNVGSYLFITFQSLSTRNFVKFQTISPSFLQLLLIALIAAIDALFFNNKSE